MQTPNVHFLLFVKTTGRSGLVGVHSTAKYISPETECNRLAEDKLHARRLIVNLRHWTLDWEDGGFETLFQQRPPSSVYLAQCLHTLPLAMTQKAKPVCVTGMLHTD